MGMSDVPAERPLILLPAVDVVDGKAVRLVQGVAGSETDYGSAVGAALGGRRRCAAVELSGGSRDDASLTAALDAGCARVNLGTAALENPQWCARAIVEHGDMVAVGLDVKVDGARAGHSRLTG